MVSWRLDLELREKGECMAGGGRGEGGGKVPFKSAPAQNARPSPVTMPTRSKRSLSSHAQRASSSWWPALLMQLRAFGRERVTRRMCGLGKEILVNEVGGGGVEKFEEAIESMYGVERPG